MNDSNDWEKFKKNVKPLKNSSIFFEKKEKVNVSFSKEVAEQTSSDFLGFSDGFSTEKMHIDKILFKKIKKGIIKPESTLDLHGKKYIEAEKSTYYFVLSAAILLSVFSNLTPYLLKITVDDHIRLGNYDGTLKMTLLMFGALFIEVLFQFLFVFYANWLGQKVVKDLRVDLFRKIIQFKMDYFDTTAVGRLVTRSVNDIETIASIFSQGLFMIIADFLKMALR